MLGDENETLKVEEEEVIRKVDKLFFFFAKRDKQVSTGGGR